MGAAVDHDAGLGDVIWRPPVADTVASGLENTVGHVRGAADENGGDDDGGADDTGNSETGVSGGGHDAVAYASATG